MRRKAGAILRRSKILEISFLLKRERILEMTKMGLERFWSANENSYGIE
jgi:hypothetical protein